MVHLVGQCPIVLVEPGVEIGVALVRFGDKQALPTAFLGEAGSARVGHPDLYRPQPCSPKLVTPALHALRPCPDLCHGLHVALHGQPIHRRHTGASLDQGDRIRDAAP